MTCPNPTLIARVRELASQRISTRIIANRTGLDRNTIHKIVHRLYPYGGDTRKVTPHPPRYVDDPVRNSDIIAGYEAGASTPYLAAKHGLSSQRISKILREAGIAVRRGGRSVCARTDELPRVASCPVCAGPAPKGRRAYAEWALGYSHRCECGMSCPGLGNAVGVNCPIHTGVAPVGAEEQTT